MSLATSVSEAPRELLFKMKRFNFEGAESEARLREEKENWSVITPTVDKISKPIITDSRDWGFLQLNPT
jgi:Ethanolamine utilization protein EutJ (predicted chaperonin)